MQLTRHIQRIILSSSAYLDLKVRLGKDPLSNIARRDLTDICIEGFPRSGNSFATSMFLLANPECRIAHHTHNLGNVKKSVSIGVPTLVLIRNPIDAITSLCLYRQTDSKRAIRSFLKEYLYFYKGVKKIRNELVEVAEFSDVISKFNLIIDRLNRKFSQDFNRLQDISMAEKSVKEDYSEKFKREALPSTQFPFPTGEKKKKKEEILPLVRRDELYVDVDSLYKYFVSNQFKAKEIY